jgi:hypothetical protein
MASVGQRNSRKQIVRNAVLPENTLLVRQRNEAVHQADRVYSQNIILQGHVASLSSRIRAQQEEIGKLRGNPSVESVLIFVAVVGVLAIGSYFV